MCKCNENKKKAQKFRESLMPMSVSDFVNLKYNFQEQRTFKGPVSGKRFVVSGKNNEILVHRTDAEKLLTYKIRNNAVFTPFEPEFVEEVEEIVVEEVAVETPEVEVKAPEVVTEPEVIVEEEVEKFKEEKETNKTNKRNSK